MAKKKGGDSNEVENTQSLGLRLRLSPRQEVLNTGDFSDTLKPPLELCAPPFPSQCRLHPLLQK
jgi:hypothetical protein